jgi:taurine dioxygenase
MKAMLDGLVAVNSAGLKHYGGRHDRHNDVGSMKLRNTDKADSIEALHPVVRTHPETGRKALYINRAHTVRFDGMTDDESKPLIEFLTDHATRPEYTCRVRWRPGTLTVWDNRCTQHFAVNDYFGQRRRSANRLAQLSP